VVWRYQFLNAREEYLEKIGIKPKKIITELSEMRIIANPAVQPNLLLDCLIKFFKFLIRLGVNFR
jgi:hypothetical protein